MTASILTLTGVVVCCTFAQRISKMLLSFINVSAPPFSFQRKKRNSYQTGCYEKGISFPVLLFDRNGAIGS